MNTYRLRIVIVLVSLLFLATGCAFWNSDTQSVKIPETNMTATGKGATAGAVIGGGLGAIIGSASGNAGEGLAIGALTGAAAGGVIGNTIEGQQAKEAEVDERLRRNEEQLQQSQRELEEMRRKAAEDDVASQWNKSQNNANRRYNPSGYRSNSPAAGTYANPSTYVDPANYSGHSVSSYNSASPAPTPTPTARIENNIENNYASAPQASLPPSQVASSTKPLLSTTPLPSTKPPASTISDANRSTLEILQTGKADQLKLVEPVKPVKPALPGAKISKQTPKSIAPVAKRVEAPPVKPATVAPSTASAALATPTKVVSSCPEGEHEAERARRAASDADKLFYFRRAMRLCPEQAQYRVEIGKVFKQIGRTGDAAEEFKQALKLDPNNIEASTLLNEIVKSGNVVASIGDTDTEY